MKTTFRHCLHALLAFEALSSGGAAQAQEIYPEKPVRLVVPSGSGGNADLLSRIIAQKLRETLGQQFVVDNRPGANAVIGTAIVAKAAPDGYTLLFPSTTHAITPGLIAKLPFDPIQDFAAVSLVGSTPMIICVSPALVAKTVKDLIALAKANPGQFNYASVGGPTHFAGVLFNTITASKIEHVPYKEPAQAFPALMSGQVHLMYPSATSVMPYGHL